MSSTNSTPIPPFNSLPVEISLLIIQKLSLSDVQNLALTCSKWYQTTLSLPESLKFSINYKYVDLTINGFTVLYNNEQILFTPENKFSIVKKVSIKELFINSNKIYNNGKYSCQDLVNFLYENRSYLNIDRIVLCGYFTEEYFMLVDSIVNMAYALDLKGYIMKFEEYGKHKLDAGKFIKKHLHNSYISCDMPISLATINSILKQWLAGDRPNMRHFKFKFEIHESSTSWGDLNHSFNIITSDISEYVEDILNIDINRNDTISFNISKPGIGRSLVELNGWNLVFNLQSQNCD